MASTARTRAELGAYGEARAARYLVEQGMVVLERNWRCPAGELDLVLLDDRTLVVCEVKTRSSLRCGSALEAVTPAKAGRLSVLAERWVSERRVRPSHVRIDLVGILLHGVAVVSLDHVRGVA